VAPVQTPTRACALKRRKTFGRSGSSCCLYTVSCRRERTFAVFLNQASAYSAGGVLQGLGDRIRGIGWGSSSSIFSFKEPQAGLLRHRAISALCCTRGPSAPSAPGHLSRHLPVRIAAGVLTTFSGFGCLIPLLIAGVASPSVIIGGRRSEITRDALHMVRRDAG